MAAKSDNPDWGPARIDENGHELIGDFPASGPARAMAIHKAGRKTDPDGVLAPDQIAAFAGPPEVPARQSVAKIGKKATATFVGSRKARAAKLQTVERSAREALPAQTASAPAAEGSTS
ncbi:MAG TPA: hypothetical protein VE053_06715 [Allosphingosinicella sp.]|nr:hypothetical protein [Allosphingosinicella sp.]